MRDKFLEVSNLGHEFLHVAHRVAVTIINELYLPLDHKTIRPVAESAADCRAKEGGRGMGGRAGWDQGLHWGYYLPHHPHPMRWHTKGLTRRRRRGIQKHHRHITTVSKAIPPAISLCLPPTTMNKTTTYLLLFSPPCHPSRTTTPSSYYNNYYFLLTFLLLLLLLLLHVTGFIIGVVVMVVLAPPRPGHPAGRHPAAVG